jgi:hypothetical protein
MGAQECRDHEWLYHTTTKATALLIKGSSMRSALARTGVAQAQVDGAFARNKDARFREKMSEHLQALVFEVYNAGFPLKELGRWKDAPPGATFDALEGTTDAPAADLEAHKIRDEYIKHVLRIGLVGAEKAPSAAASSSSHTPASSAPVPTSHKPHLKPWQKMGTAAPSKPFPKTGTPQAPTPVVPKKVDYKIYWTPAITEVRDDLLKLEDHFLVRLARRWTEMYYAVEERTTASHIYFATAKGAAAAYNTYKKTLKGELVVLRVRKVHVPDCVPDESEQDGVKATESVAANLFDVMVEHVKFPDIDYRCNEANWKRLSELV